MVLWVFKRKDRRESSEVPEGHACGIEAVHPAFMYFQRLAMKPRRSEGARSTAIALLKKNFVTSILFITSLICIEHFAIRALDCSNCTYGILLPFSSFHIMMSTRVAPILRNYGD